MRRNAAKVNNIGTVSRERLQSAHCGSMSVRSAPSSAQFVNRPSVLIMLAIVVSATVGCNTQATSATSRQRTLADSADQVMFNARMTIAGNGVRRGEVYGDTVLAFDAATRFDVRPMRVQFATALGRPLALMTAPGGEYLVARSLLQTRGPVTMSSDTTRRRVTATAVRYDPVTNQIASDSAFTATSGTRQLSGVGFTTDPGLFTIKCLQRCNGSLGR